MILTPLPTVAFKELSSDDLLTGTSDFSVNDIDVVVGAAVNGAGTSVGNSAGTSVGSIDGISVGPRLGISVGAKLGISVGTEVGNLFGPLSAPLWVPLWAYLLDCNLEKLSVALWEAQ